MRKHQANTQKASLVGKHLNSVSVVVSTYTVDRASHVLDCIRSLKSQTLPPKEVILVLDPNDELVNFYKSRVPFGVTLIVSEKPGLSCARNIGAKNALGEIVAFIDDDAIADEKWLENMVSNYDDLNVLGVGGFVKPLWENKRPTWFPEELNWIVGCSYKGLPENKSLIRNPIGCNMSFRKTVFEKVGYFRTDIGRFGKKLTANEETAFSIRVLEKMPGSKIVYDPSAVVYHMVDKTRANLKYVLKRSFYEGVSKALITDSKSNPLRVLSTENRYLRYLFKTAIPSRLRRIYKFKSTCHLPILFFSTCSVLTGFLFGKFTKVVMKRWIQ